jgi:hypothetical protein
MANESLIVGNSNWAVKANNLLGYAVGETSGYYVPRELNFTRNSTATYTDENGIIQTAAANIARVQDNALLLEPQRTNLLLRSEEFDNVYWNKVAVSVTANNTTAPDGSNAADLIIENSSSTGHAISRGGLGLGSGTYTCTIYAKQKERSRILLFGGGATLQGYGFDLINGTANAVTGITAPSSFSIENVGNGWYRCSITITSTTFNSFQTYLLSSFSGFSYTGDGTSGLYVWGAQLEAGSYPTSYIPTTSATVTRLADSCSKTGISSLIGQTEGTLYWEGRTISGVGTDLLIVGDITNSVFINITSSNQVRIGIRANNALLLSPSGGTIAANNKIALAYKSGDIVAYLNGIEVITNSTSFTFSDLISSIEIGRPFYDAKATQFNQASALFTTRLTNTQLAELTTL